VQALCGGCGCSGRFPLPCPPLAGAWRRSPAASRNAVLLGWVEGCSRVGEAIYTYATTAAAAVSFSLSTDPPLWHISTNKLTKQHLCSDKDETQILRVRRGQTCLHTGRAKCRHTHHGCCYSGLLTPSILPLATTRFSSPRCSVRCVFLNTCLS